MFLHPEQNWQKVVEFHGHACPGLAIGVTVTALAAEYLEISQSSKDEEILCIAETDACSVDAVQSLLGCTLGKGNLLLKPRGKHAFTFYSRARKKGCRIIWSGPSSPGQDKTQLINEILSAGRQYCKLTPAGNPGIPEAFISKSVPCSQCGELTAEDMSRFLDGKAHCLDCLPKFSRLLD